MKRILAIAASLCLVSAPALADVTQVAVIYDPQTLIVHMVVVPSVDDKELDQSAYNDPAYVQMRVLLADYKAAEAQGGLATAIQAMQVRVPGYVAPPPPVRVPQGPPMPGTE